MHCTYAFCLPMGKARRRSIRGCEKVRTSRVVLLSQEGLVDHPTGLREFPTSTSQATVACHTVAIISTMGVESRKKKEYLHPHGCPVQVREHCTSTRRSRHFVECQWVVPGHGTDLRNYRSVINGMTHYEKAHYRCHGLQSAPMEMAE